ncbi:MAG: hypothetical protein IJL75_06355 [Eubacterium sp.]|nr:hypothetical protein [Eubacterium sp.]
MVKNIKKIISIITALAATICAANIPLSVAKAEGKEMKIYGVYLQENDHVEVWDEEERDEFGDAVILESKGHYLLMDTGARYTCDSVIAALKKMGITEMDAYVSHLHPDHFNSLNMIMDDGIKINRIFLPDPSLGKDWVSAHGGTTAGMYRYLDSWIEDCGEGNNRDAKKIYLKKGSTFTVGDVNAEVLGPVGTYDMKACNKYFPDNVYGEKSGHYLNNYSLTTMFTCGDVKYLTTGDIESIENQQGSKYNGTGIKKLEEEYLVEKYGSKLQADILKMAHHGLNSSSSAAFLKAVKPRIAFAENSGYQDLASVSGKKVPKYYSTVERMHDYGITLMNGHEKAGIGITVNNNAISVYLDKNNDTELTDAEKLTGWVSVCGISNKKGTDFTGNDVFYVDPDKDDFKLASGINNINGKNYLFTKGGALERAFYKGSSYLGWRTYGKKYRYFSKPDTFGRAEMTIGFKKIGANYFYFDKNGYRFAPSKGDSNSKGKLWKLKKIGKYYYLIKKKNGAVYNMGKSKNAFMPFSGGKLRAFDKKGRMITGKAKVNGKTYTFNKKTGYKK